MSELCSQEARRQGEAALVEKGNLGGFLERAAPGTWRCLTSCCGFTLRRSSYVPSLRLSSSWYISSKVILALGATVTDTSNCSVCLPAVLGDRTTIAHWLR